MANKQLYQHFMSQLDDATPAEADIIISQAFAHYVKDNLDDTQYAKIYFKATDLINRVFYGSKNKRRAG